MKHSSSLEVESCLASQEIRRILWDPNFHHCLH